MKKLLLVAVLAVFSVCISAQGLKGTWFAGGQLSFNSSTDKYAVIDKTTGEQKITSTTVLPIIGTFVSPDVAIGIGLGYMGKTNKFEGEQYLKSTNFVAKPLVRKYWNISGGLFFYGQAALPVIIGDSEGVKDSGKTKNLSIGLELAPGFDYVINSWMTIETSFTILNTGYSRSKPKGGDASSSFGFNANPFNSIGDRTVGELQVGVKFLF
ncbi:hypothetical protein [Dysgonomonas mossii]|uniref:hypothetical protein n=1 Tax=Dysgonomonas mossii TaxID=163665 RepID=UPI003993291C